eukprot:g13499.t1
MKKAVVLGSKSKKKSSVFDLELDDDIFDKDEDDILKDDGEGADEAESGAKAVKAGKAAMKKKVAEKAGSKGKGGDGVQNELDAELVEMHSKKGSKKDGEKKWYLHKGPDEYKKAFCTTDAETKSFDKASADQSAAIAVHLFEDRKLTARRAELRAELADIESKTLKQETEDAEKKAAEALQAKADKENQTGKGTSRARAGSKDSADGNDAVAAKSKIAAAGASTSSPELQALTREKRKVTQELNKNAAALKDLRTEKLRPLYAMASKADFEYSGMNNIPTMTGSILRHYPSEWAQDEMKSRKKNPREFEKNYHRGDVYEWRAGDEFLLRVSWPLSLKRKPYKEKLTAEDGRKAYADLIARVENEETTYLGELWTDHVAAEDDDVIERLLRAQGI